MYWQRAVYFPLVDHLVQELSSVTRESFLRILSCSSIWMLSAAEYKISFTNPTIDLSKKRDFDNEILTWQTKWSHSTDEKPVTHLTETLQHANPDLYPNVVTTITILLTMPVSTATPERSFSTMRRVKTYLVRSTMKTERQAALALMHAYRDIPIDVEAVIREFCAKKNRRLAFEFLWVPPRFWICLQLMCRLSGHKVVVVVDNNHNWLHFVKYSIISCSIWNPGICQLI